ncbi:MAG: FG-GAP-like repeat-containing protein [Planctomycetia bacterium]|nr:FG-GAP-like repeat-containing protein [Planctomycetia bacterium]
MVYTGGRDLPENQAGFGGFGGYEGGGSSSFLSILDGRGQAGALATTPTDFGPWGGAITFDTVGTTWHFGTTTSGLDNSKVDFLTVAQHELAHLFGFGTAPSWQNQISGSNFTGPVSKAANENVNVPLGDAGHWALSVTSGGELATMRATLTQGQRHLMTAIDFAGLDDLGWTVTTPVLLDFGDAPDTTSGTGTGNYQTLSSNNGPRHTIVSGLFLGDRVDADNGLQANAAADGDDQFTSPGADDEDGVLSPVDLLGTVGAAPTISLLATNTTGSAATLFGWIDYNQNGLFDNATERAQVTVPIGTTDGRFTLTFPTIPVGSAGATYARFRLSTDVAAANSTGAASNGEVEDYRFTITKPSTGLVASSVKLSSGQNGAPSLTDEDSFGSSVTSIGDLDGDGVTDLVVGAERDGAIYVLRMNANGTVKSSTKIASGTNGITSGTFFGSSVASLGDVDGDGVPDLAVGASNDATGQLGAGAVYVLRLNADGTVKSSTKIASGLNGGPTLANSDQFGTSVASLGDLDGDGVTDLAVGAINDSSAGTQRGVVYVLRLNADGTVKGSTKIASGTNGGPTLANFDLFGSSVAAIGDLDGDGVTDLAVGAFGDSAGANRGAVYVLRMNADGTVKSSTKTASGTNGGPALSDDDNFGSSVAAVGDLDGDGVIDLAVGAFGDNTNGNSRGAIYVLRLNADGTAKSSTKIASGTNGGPALTDNDLFGSAVTAVGDLNGDGVTDLAVGAPFSNNPPFSQVPGSVHVLFLERVNQNPDVSNLIPDQTAIVGVPFSFTIPANTFTDPDGDPLTILADEISPWLSFDSETRTYSGTPGPDDLGSVELFVVAIDPQGLNTDDVFVITVSNQNVAPSFTKGANVVRPGDGAVQTISGWATNINDGSSDNQALDFLVTIPSANAGLFNVAPAIAANGTLTFTPKPGATGTVTVTVRLHDNGGTANGGADLSPAQTFTIQLTGLNKTPSFTKGTNPAINEDVSLQTIVTWAKSIIAGTGESGQTVAFTLTNNNNALFSQQPDIAPNGNLTFTPC